MTADGQSYLYIVLITVLLGIGLGEENAILCCAAALFAIAGEIQAKGGDGNG